MLDPTHIGIRIRNWQIILHDAYIEKNPAKSESLVFSYTFHILDT